jgi:hypothetical protein
MRNVLRILPSLLVALALAAPAAAAGPMSDDEILRNFEKIALQAGDAASSRGTIVKWTKDIRVWVRSDLEPKRHRELQAMVESQAEHLAFITGLRIAVIERGAANFLVIFANDIHADTLAKYRDSAKIFFASEKQMEELLASTRKRGVCAGFLGRNAAGAVTGAVVLIPYGLDPRLILACVSVEMTQVLGLLNESSDARLSLLNSRVDKHRQVALTYHDMLLLRILYDPRMKHGMSGSDALPLARRILGEVR